MKPIVVDHGETFASSILKPINMGISEDPEDGLMIMNVLTNTLYTNRIAAVLREYGCNAADANVEAGATRPFEVRLPNKLEPTLTIRDFGPSMNGEQIASTFAKLGRSTKRGSNAFTGMLGIGSKAGFAYGDSFMVTAFTKGLREVYNCYRDKGVPRLVLMHKEATTEPDGVEIKVPVKVQDIDEFVSTAKRVYQYFKVRPIVTGAKVEFDDKKPFLSGEGWRYIGDGVSVAVMGNVGYDLKLAGMGVVPPGAQALVSRGIELYFDIGDVEIAANREGLQYGDHTKKVLLERLDRVATEIAKNFTEQVGKAASLWEAKSIYGTLFPNVYGQSDLRSIVKGKVQWNGKTIDGGQVELRDEEGAGLTIWKVYKYYGRTRREQNPWNIHASDKVTLVDNDLESGKSSPARERGWFAAHPEAESIVVVTFPSEAARKGYVKGRGLEGAAFVKLSSIPPLKTQSASSGGGTKNSKHSTKVFTLDEKTVVTASANSAYWTQSSVDLGSDSGIYVVLDSFVVTAPQYVAPRQLRNHVTHLRGAGLLGKQPVYGFKKAIVTRIGSGWTRLDVHVKAQLDKRKKEIEQDMSDYLAAAAYPHIFDAKWASLMPPGSPAARWLEEQARMLSPASGKELLALLHSGDARPWAEKPAALVKPTTDLKKLEGEMMARYPMLELWSRAYTYGGRLRSATEEEMEKAAAYVKLYEEANKNKSRGI